MPLMDSKTGKIRKAYSPEELEDAANLMRGYSLIALGAAGSGHSGGTLSLMDVAAALYLHEANLDPEDPFWSDRDRIFWSAGHKAPILYVSLGMAGFFDIDEVVTLRKLHSPFQGHPHWLRLAGVEASSGSLGQGLSISVGDALAARLDKKDYRVYCLMGDGETNEGQVWEAAMTASHYKLDSLCAIIDYNKLQIDGFCCEVKDMGAYLDKWKDFGWHVIETDGHDIEKLMAAFDKAKTVKGEPTIIVAHTIKGKGVSFLEGADRHGKATSEQERAKAIAELKVKA